MYTILKIKVIIMGKRTSVNPHRLCRTRRKAVQFDEIFDNSRLIMHVEALKTLINFLHGFEECKPLEGEQPAKEVIPAWSRYTVEETNDMFFDLKLIKYDHCSSSTLQSNLRLHNKLKM